jgi:cysteine desulfurase
MAPIYLDYNATTPIDPRVAEAMMPYLQKNFGNPSSSHAFGVATKKAVETARRQVIEQLRHQGRGACISEQRKSYHHIGG